MSTLAEKVRTWRLANNLTRGALADLVGQNRQVIDNLEHGDTTNPRYLLQLARVMGTSPDYLMDPELPPPSTPVVKEPRRPYAVERVERDNASTRDLPARRVPLISKVPGGDWEHLVDALSVGDSERMVETTADVGPFGFALTVTGYSMVSPTGPHSFPPGTILFVNPDIEPQVGRYVIVRQNGDTEFTFKRLARDAGRWILEPLNPKYDVIQLGEDAHICGVVVKAEINTL